MLTNLSTWLLEAAPAAAPAADAAKQAGETGGFLGMIPQLAMMVVMVGVFYFLLIRPQRKKDKAVKDMLAAIKVGDRICTIGGIYGTVTALKDDTVTILVGAPKTPMVLARWAIRSVENAPLENDAEPQV
ncbi:preprotein translocase subunit YajC [Bacillota bacterium Meth-B3]|nr:preprotein translocase subunit YajC [Christensenellaceae bacterium]MEA5065230.1 preprotein translocase subunit YajC [Eubacteriales bacterium]MEA5068549.1 preprotein translocase subunit YajC [Christensenellaceae bacterium]